MTQRLQCKCGCDLKIPSQSSRKSVTCPQCGARLNLRSEGPAKSSALALSSFVSVDEPGAPPVQEEGHSWGSLSLRPIVIEETDDVQYNVDLGKRVTVRLLGVLLTLIAIAGAIPAGQELAVALQAETFPGLGRWVFVLAFVTILQVAYALFLAQFPDWGAVRVASIFLMFVAVGYSILAGLTVLPMSQVATFSYFELAGRYARHEVAGWSVCMLCITCLMSYLVGKLATRWQTHQR